LWFGQTAVVVSIIPSFCLQLRKTIAVGCPIPSHCFIVLSGYLVGHFLVPLAGHCKAMVHQLSVIYHGCLSRNNVDNLDLAWVTPYNYCPGWHLLLHILLVVEAATLGSDNLREGLDTVQPGVGRAVR
ncbi:unnamed protein product, partial [Chrysoparadoxa australica]